MVGIRELMHRAAGTATDLARYSDDDINRLLALPAQFAAKCPDEPRNDCPYDDVSQKYFYFCDITAEAKNRGLPVPEEQTWKQN